jgi:hypothetical protein
VQVPDTESLNEPTRDKPNQDAVGAIDRRGFIAGSLVALGGVGAISAACSNLGGNPNPTTSTTSTTVALYQNPTISNEHRLSLRALWDAVVPGNWNGNVEDGGAPGADQANVEAWLEQVASDLSGTGFIDWLTEEFLDLWGADIDAWAQLTTLGSQEFWQMPLGDTIVDPSTRQGKIILMQNLLVPGVETIFDLQYLGAIMLAKLAFYGDFWAERNAPNVMIGRAYCGAHLPPGTTANPNASFGVDFGIHDPNLISVDANNPALTYDYDKAPNALIALP